MNHNCAKNKCRKCKRVFVYDKWLYFSEPPVLCLDCRGTEDVKVSVGVASKTLWTCPHCNYSNDNSILGHSIPRTVTCGACQRRYESKGCADKYQRLLEDVHDLYINVKNTTPESKLYHILLRILSEHMDISEIGKK